MNNHHRTRRILVVDDEEEIRAYLEKVLLKAGYEVLLVDSGKAAIGTLQNENVDAALVDLMLGDLNGIEVLKFAKRNIPSVEIIVMSAYGTFGNVVELIQQGALDFLEKPFEVNILLSRVEKAMHVRDLNLRFQYLDEQYNNIKQLKQFSESIINSIPHAILTVDNEGRISTANGLLMKIFFEKEENVIDREIREFFRLKFDDSESVIAAYERMRERQKSVSMLLYNNTVGNEQRHFRFTASPLAGGSLIQLSDITEEYNARQRLNQREKMAMLGEFVSSVTHGLGNNMANIISNASGAVEEADLLGRVLRECEKTVSEGNPIDAEWAKTHLGEIGIVRSRINDYSGRLLKRVYELDENIKSLLNFTRLKPPQKVSTDLNAVVEEAVSVAKSLDTKQITFLKSLSKEIPPAEIDPLQIKSVVIDIVINAIQSIIGKGTIIYETGYVPATGAVQIRVSDTGSGIKESDQERIFDAFYTTKSNGTGLGLVNVKNIVRQHEGKISIKSEPGKGTMFVVELPAGSTADRNPGNMQIRSN